MKFPRFADARVSVVSAETMLTARAVCAPDESSKFGHLRMRPLSLRVSHLPDCGPFGEIEAALGQEQLAVRSEVIGEARDDRVRYGEPFRRYLA